MALNSEARKRQQEAQGFPEQRLLTEVHPLYTGEMQVNTPLSLCKPEAYYIHEQAELLEQVREELAAYE